MTVLLVFFTSVAFLMVGFQLRARKGADPRLVRLFVLTGAAGVAGSSLWVALETVWTI